MGENAPSATCVCGSVAEGHPKMSTSTHPANGELVQISPVEEAIRQRVAEERARLEKQAGLAHRSEERRVGKECRL